MEKGKRRLTWAGIIIVGMLSLLIAVLAITTESRIRRARELMETCLYRQGSVLIESLEGVIRAGVRQGNWRMNMLSAMTRELAENPFILSVAVISQDGKAIAWDKQEASSSSGDPLGGFPNELRSRVLSNQDILSISKDEVIIGRSLEPFRNLRGLARPYGETRPAEPWGRGGGARSGGGMFGPPHSEIKAYALVRLSTETFNQTQNRDRRQAIILGLLIFAASGIACLGLVAAARHRSREFQRLQDEMAKLEYMAAVGRLAAAVAHKIRNPLSTVRGLIQYLEGSGEAEGEKSTCAKAAVDELGRAERIIAGLLEYSRSRPSEPRPVKLAEVVQDAVASLASDPWAKAVEIRNELPADLPEIMGDPEKLGRVFGNLISNSLEAMNGKGRIAIQGRLEAERVVVEVIDDGPGLPKGDPEQVFEPFFSTNPFGVGLGLTVARGVAQAHGGELVAQNGPNGGARFTLRLPLTKGGNKS